MWCMRGSELVTSRTTPCTSGADTAQPFYRGCQRVGLDIGEHDVRAGFREGVAECEADTAPAARDEACLTSKLSHNVPL